MSNEESRETIIPATKQELFYYDEDKKTFKPLVSDGTVPVRIVGEDELDNVGSLSIDGEELVARETKIQTPKQELFYYDKTSKTYKPLAHNGAIPVYIVGKNDNDDDDEIDGGTF